MHFCKSVKQKNICTHLVKYKSKKAVRKIFFIKNECEKFYIVQPIRTYK